MDFYLTGFFAALIIGIIKLVISLSEVFSRRAQNLSKIGLHWDFWSGNYFPKKTGKLSFFFVFIYLIFIAPLFSWLSVASAAVFYIVRKANQTTPPDRIKEIQFKLSHADLSKNEVVNLKKELDSFLGIEIEEDPANILNLEQPAETDWTETLTAIPSKMTFEVVDHPSDYGIINYTTCQYRIEGDKVMARLLDFKRSSMGDMCHCVSDGVVLEQAIIEDMKDNHLQSASEQIEIFKNKLEWHELQDYRIRYFLLQKHPEALPISDFRKSVRTYIERIQSGYTQLCDFAKQKNYHFDETNSGMRLKLDDGASESAKEEYNSFLSERTLRDKYNLSWDEYINYKKYLTNLNAWLNLEEGNY